MSEAPGPVVGRLSVLYSVQQAGLRTGQSNSLRSHPPSGAPSAGGASGAASAATRVAGRAGKGSPAFGAQLLDVADVLLGSAEPLVAGVALNDEGLIAAPEAPGDAPVAKGPEADCDLGCAGGEEVRAVTPAASRWRRRTFEMAVSSASLESVGRTGPLPPERAYIASRSGRSVGSIGTSRVSQVFVGLTCWAS